MKKFIAYYSLLFAIISLCIFFPFYSRHLTLVWEPDGAPQYILWLYYTGEWLRRLFLSVLPGHAFPAFYDFTIGLGDDVGLLLKTEPVLLIGSLFVNLKNISTVYTVLTIVRIYLMGVSFGIFARHKGISSLHSAFGGLVYAFSGYTMYYILRHPQFALGPIFLPLLLTSVSLCLEEGRNRRNIFLLLAVSALSLFSGYYFHYMSTIAVCVYVLLFILFSADKKRAFQGALRAGAGFTAGCCLAAIRFIPSFFLYLGCDRSVFGSSGSLLSKIAGACARRGMIINPRQLFHFPAVLISPTDTVLGPMSFCTCALIIPAAVSLWTGKAGGNQLAKTKQKTLNRLARTGQKTQSRLPEEAGKEAQGHSPGQTRERTLKAAFILVVLGLCMPAVTLVFTGFGTDYQRWAYIAVFVFAFIIVDRLPDLSSGLSNAGLAVLLIIAGIYGALYYFIYIYEDVFLISFSFVFITAGVIVLLHIFKPGKFPASAVFILIGLAGVLWSASYSSQEMTGGMPLYFLTKKEVSNYFKGGAFQMASEIKDSSFFRISIPDLPEKRMNGAVWADVNGVSSYSSIINGNVVSWLRNTENPGLHSTCIFNGADQSFAPENFLNVKYLFCTLDSGVPVPYNFKEDKALQKELETDYRVYVNQTPLSAGYAYKEVVSQSDYMSQPALEQQMSLMDKAVFPDELVDGEEVSKGNEGSFEDYGNVIQNLPLDISLSEEMITRKGNHYLVDSSECEDEPGEAYYDAESVDDMYGVHYRTKIPEAGDLYIRVSGLGFRNQNATEIKVASDTVRKTIHMENTSSDYYTGQKDFTVFMGHYHKAGDARGVVAFINDDNYTIDKIEAFLVPEKWEKEMVSKREEICIPDMKVSGDEITGTVSGTDRPYIVFSVPYRRGWRAYVDDKKVQTFFCNGGFVGLSLKGLADGPHRIRLKYSPW